MNINNNVYNINKKIDATIFFKQKFNLRAERLTFWPFFCSGRVKCIYALTGEPLFETKTGVLLYWIGLTVLNRIPTTNLSPEVTRALQPLSRFLWSYKFKLCPLTLRYSPHNHSWFVFHTKQLLPKYAYIQVYIQQYYIQAHIPIWLPQLLTTTSMREQQQLYSLWIGLSVHVIRWMTTTAARSIIPKYLIIHVR